MEKNVLITIKGRQEYSRMEPDTVELLTRGTLSKDEDGFRLTYEESELTGIENTVTTIRVSNQTVSLLRSGAVNSELVLEPGKLSLSMYETAFGSLAVGINSRIVRVRTDEHCGEIELDYSTEVDHLPLGHNVFRITYQEHVAKSRAEPGHFRPVPPPQPEAPAFGL